MRLGGLGGGGGGGGERFLNIKNPASLGVVSGACHLCRDHNHYSASGLKLFPGVWPEKCVTNSNAVGFTAVTPRGSRQKLAPDSWSGAGEGRKGHFGYRLHTFACLRSGALVFCRRCGACLWVAGTMGKTDVLSHRDIHKNGMSV